MIYDMEPIDEIEEINRNYEKIIQLKELISDKTSEIRECCNNLGCDYDTILYLSHESEKTLLIDCYTFAEKLLKNTIYHCVDFENSDNSYVNAFLRKKIDPRKFSPNVKYEFFMRELTELEENRKYKFIIPVTDSRIKSYNNMIAARHKYAHANNYPMQIDHYKDVIIVLEYLTWECDMFICDKKKHLEIQEKFNKINSDKKNLQKKINKYSGEGGFTEKIEKLRREMNEFFGEYDSDIKNVQIFDEYREKNNKIQTLDFVDKNTVDGKKIAQLKNYLNLSI